MVELTELPNIGPVLAACLKEADVKTPEELRALGAQEVFLRLRLRDNTACLHKLLALEGAVEGIPKKLLSSEKKQELNTFYKGLNQDTKK